MYSQNFYPCWLCELEEVKDELDNPAVNMTFYFKVHFVKKIPFIGGKIAKEAMKEFKENKIETFMPLAKTCVDENIAGIRRSNSL